MTTATLLVGDAYRALASVPESSCATIITSPPYFRQRRYTDSAEEIGDAGTLEEYLTALVEVFSAARSKLIPGGILWVNIGDTYNSYNRNRGGGGELSARRDASRSVQEHRGLLDPERESKSALGVPQRLASRLVDDGWILRADITWEKRAMPERVRDRPRRATERILMLAERPRNLARVPGDRPDLATDVWRLPTASGASEHSARFSAALPAACLAWLRDVPGAVLDPFSGSGSTGLAAAAEGRDYFGADLSREFTEEARVLLSRSFGEVRVLP